MAELPPLRYAVRREDGKTSHCVVKAAHAPFTRDEVAAFRQAVQRETRVELHEPTMGRSLILATPSTNPGPAIKIMSQLSGLEPEKVAGLNQALWELPKPRSQPKYGPIAQNHPSASS